MDPKAFRRKLAAILSADVAGYSRLMQGDEAATVATLEAYKQIFSDLINQHRGRVVDSPGDNLLAEFASVVDAVQCAVAVQKELQARNADLPENRKMLFRIGVNLGDVIEEGSRIYGDGVNIAARLESLADAGGICVSKTAFDQIETKLPFGYEFLGEQTVKNIDKPVGTYRVLMEPRVTVAGPKVKGRKIPLRRHKAVLAGAIALILAAVGLGTWNFYWSAPQIEPASVKKMALPLPDMPSIAVLPFVNISGDPAKDYLSDGITEEIISALARLPYVFVIARNSSFTYKGKPVKVQQVSEEMGVQYVLEGSVQWTEDRVRITAQLIDALKGHHVFSERYDYALKDIFAVQDEITIKVLTAMQVALTKGEQAPVGLKGTKNLDAYLKLLQAFAILGSGNREKVALARQLVEESLSLDPNYTSAIAGLANVYVVEVYVGGSKSPRESLDRAEELAKKAISSDASHSDAHCVLSLTYVFKKQFDKAISEAETAVALSPGSSFAVFMLGTTLLHSERFEEAIPYFKKSLRLSPIANNQCLVNLGAAFRFLGRYDEAIETFRKLLQRQQDHLPGHVNLAATYVLAGREEEARFESAEVMRIDPQFSLERWAKMSPYRQAVVDQVVETLRKAGLK
jgi:adenylate cyclase